MARPAPGAPRKNDMNGKKILRSLLPDAATLTRRPAAGRRSAVGEVRPVKLVKRSCRVSGARSRMRSSPASCAGVANGACSSSMTRDALTMARAGRRNSSAGAKTFIGASAGRSAQLSRLDLCQEALSEMSNRRAPSLGGTHLVCDEGGVLRAAVLLLHSENPSVQHNKSQEG